MLAVRIERLIPKVAREVQHVEATVTRVAKREARETKQQMAAHTQMAGLGKLSRTWRALSFPKAGQSVEAAGYVYPKARKAIEGHEAGPLLRATGSVYMALPTENAPKRGTDGRRIKPSTWPAGRLGPLTPIKTGSGKILLIASSLRQRGGKRPGFAKASKTALRTGRGLVSAVMFILVRQAKLPKRLDVAGESLKAMRRFAGTLARALGAPGS